MEKPKPVDREVRNTIYQALTQDLTSLEIVCIK